MEYSRKKVHLIINKKSYVDVMNKYIEIIFKETKDFESIEKKWFNGILYWWITKK